MDSGDTAFTIHTVTYRLAVTIVGFVEGQPQKLAENIAKVYFEHKM